MKPNTVAACLRRIEKARAIPVEAWGAEHNGLRWCLDVDRCFRTVRKTTELSRHIFSEYYTNHFCDLTTCGLVAQLPGKHRKPRYVAGHSDPDMSEAACFDLREVYSDEMECARAAEELARVYADQCREFDAQQLAELDIEDAREQLSAARREHKALAQDIRAQFPVWSRNSPVCKALCAQLKSWRKEAHDSMRLINERRRDPWSAVESRGL